MTRSGKPLLTFSTPSGSSPLPSVEARLNDLLEASNLEGG